MAFTRAEIREILGEAHTDEIAGKLIALHRGVVDPIKDALDDAKRESAKYKTEADKVPGLQKDLDALKGGEDWKGKYEREKSDFDAYKTKIAKDAEIAKVKAAYKKLLAEERVSEKTIDAVMSATDYSTMKLKDDGTLDGIDDLKKDIDAKWGSFKVQQRQRGQQVDNPPKDQNGGSDTSIREMTSNWHAAKFGAPKQQ